VLRKRLEARDENSLCVARKGQRLSFNAWADIFLENYSKPPMRTENTHVANVTALKNLCLVFGNQKLSEIDADQIENYLRRRLTQRKKVRRVSGIVELGLIKPSTAHQESRVLRRILNVAVKKKLCPANPCAAVEFPVKVKGMFRPHYMTRSEQQSIEFHAPRYLRNVIRIITETGLRVYSELAGMRKEQVDLANVMLFIPDSKTPNGVAEVPLTEAAVEAFQSQIQEAGSNLPFMVWLLDILADGARACDRVVRDTTLRMKVTPGRDCAYCMKSSSTRMRAGRPAIRSCALTDIMRRRCAPSSYKTSNSRFRSAAYASVLK
jgi:integrase